MLRQTESYSSKLNCFKMKTIFSYGHVYLHNHTHRALLDHMSKHSLLTSFDQTCLKRLEYTHPQTHNTRLRWAQVWALKLRAIEAVPFLLLCSLSLSFPLSFHLIFSSSYHWSFHLFLRSALLLSSPPISFLSEECSRCIWGKRDNSNFSLSLSFLLLYFSFLAYLKSWFT